MHLTFKQYLESQGKSKSTVIAYSRYALDFISYLDADNTEVENATAKEVLSYLSHLQKKGQENKTRNIRLNVIKQFFTWQIEQGSRTENPIAHLKIRGNKREKLYPILSKQELEEIYNTYEIPTDQHKKAKCNWFNTYQLSKQRNKAVLSLMINQGLTTPEVERITLNDLKLKEGKLYITGSRKSNERTLELKSNQIIELMEYQYTTRTQLLNYNNPEEKRLFLSVPTLGKSAATGEGNLQIWKGLTKEIKKQHPKFINFKQVRTSVITHWLKQYNLRQVQQMAGHRYVSSTERYLVNQTEDLQKDIDQFHPF
jgi:site-specific recombinase XerD|tara:strand:+ start:69 stop:1007 length:939 start_codon:yes stop_codon:yes gene_type:complete